MDVVNDVLNTQDGGDDGNGSVNMDEQVLSLIQEVDRRKKEIAELERPNWKTNCSFRFAENTTPINLHVESDIATLIHIAGVVATQAEMYNEAAVAMGVEDPPRFKWMGFSASDWVHDIKARLDKIQIKSKKDKLQKLEDRLNKIVSPELRAKIELDAIKQELD
jgi:hypothetical protein